MDRRHCRLNIAEQGKALWSVIGLYRHEKHPIFVSLYNVYVGQEI